MSGLEHFIDDVKKTDFDMTLGPISFSEEKKVLALTGLLFAIGTLISVGGCALQVRNARRQQNAEKVPALNQQIEAVDAKRFDSMAIKQLQSKKILDK